MKNSTLNWGHALAVIISLFPIGCNPDKDLPPLVYEVPERIEPYIERFKKEGEFRGVMPNMDYLKVEFVEEIQFNDSSNVIGLCIRSRNGAHTIQLDTGSLWWHLGDLAIEEIIFHELGHCFLARPHDDEVLANEDFASIMRTKGPVLYAHNPDFRYENSFKRDYYLDELFYGTAEEPCWVSNTPNPNLKVTTFTRKDFNGTASSIPENIITDRYGNTWFYAFDRFCKYLGGNSFEKIELPVLEGDDQTSWIHDVYNDQAGNIWISMNIWNNGKRTFKLNEAGNFELMFVDSTFQLSDTPYELYIVDESQVFFNSFNSFGIIDLVTNSMVNFKNEELGIELKNYFPIKIVGHPNGKVYFSKGEHFFSYEKETGVRRITNGGSNKLKGGINELIINDLGDVWMRVNREVVQFQESTNSFMQLDRVSANLLHSIIYQIGFDRENNLWVATNYGLKKFDHQQERFSGYCDYYFGADPEKLNRFGFDLENNIWVRESRSIHRLEAGTN
ncbi:hypothetical protein [Flexithrix dorotheae]|uniref:hypothetical protein n=1 Tax=Flexithrix dorotheae TaxID=70993 RepID=UPI000375FA98|nr:hypothetical protein [Flexithrix dorotheae]